ncbi:MAG: AmmeMemoRadiSam system radical SAM enzyme [Chloroflexota bacterium]|nr:AmmeMemoRadiSam system radical SAM enzyme [Chloroflexota bacterium]
MGTDVATQIRKPIAGDVPLAQTLDAMVRAGDLYEKLDNHRVRCYACGHRCVINDGARGICQVRYNRGGTLFVPHGYVAALQSDPTEKKPFFHILPGSDTLTFGMLGCDFHCGYCQNWLTSQTLRDATAGVEPMPVSAEKMVALAKRYGAKLVGSSYNEPLITSEWAIDVFRLAKQSGLRCVYVSNGNATRETLEYIRPYVDGYKIDLKTMSDRNYRKLGGVLQNVLDSIKMVYAMGFWHEIVTLIVPGFNDSTEELLDAAQFIRSVSPNIPWHVTAFHQDYKMTDNDNTDIKTLIRAAEIGQEAGLHFVYAGNLPGRVGQYENTYCPKCNTLLVERYGYRIAQDKLSGRGACPKCGEKIPGIWM